MSPRQTLPCDKVSSGENLTVNARKYGCAADKIADLNSGLIENPFVISVGRVR